MQMTESRDQRALRRQLLLICSGVRPKDIVRVTGLRSATVSGAIHGDKLLPPEAARSVANLVRRQVMALFERPGDDD